MALYVPSGARRRRLVIGIVGGLLVGLVIGFLAGRASSPGLADDVAEVQGRAVDATTALQRIPIEYEQALAGEGGESTAAISAAIERAMGQLADAYAEAIWLDDNAASATNGSFDELTALVVDEADLAEVEAAIDGLVAQIETTFAVTAEAAG
jgi:hypothetical protein